MDPHLKILQLEAELEAAHQEIQDLQHDCVSGLAVRATFEKHLEGVFQARRSSERAMGVLMIDIDNFKLVNDQHGHRVGDEVIAQVARTVRECTRATDLVARYGGEEFVTVVANGAKVAGLAILAERIRSSVEDMKIDGLPQVTVSIGFTAQNRSDRTGHDVVERADRNLYAAKEAGRNRVCHETLESPELRMISEIEESLTDEQKEARREGES